MRVSIHARRRVRLHRRRPRPGHGRGVRDARRGAVPPHCDRDARRADALAVGVGVGGVQRDVAAVDVFDGAAMRPRLVSGLAPGGADRV